jgi:hypothetical protein
VTVMAVAFVESEGIILLEVRTTTNSDFLLRDRLGLRCLTSHATGHRAEAGR